MKPLSKTQQAIELFDSTPGLTPNKAAEMVGLSPRVLYPILRRREGRCGECNRPLPKKKRLFQVPTLYEKMPHPNPPPQLFKSSDENGLAQDLPGRTSLPS